MKSFRTEFENNIVEKDIIELEKKIYQFHNGQIDGEKFRSLRLARGVYGQRQEGVQMIRIKLPYGKVTSQQLRRIADVSDEYSTGRLHTTTRQDIQIHYVSLDRTPELWAELEKDDITLREACGNTVRNITASPFSGIDPNEAFDVTPYADALFRYLLRYPVNQDLGRKFKIAFSSSDQDTGLTFMHDLGLIAKTETIDGVLVHGFKAVIGGGLGAQPFPAQVAKEFLPADQLIPFTEQIIRAYDRLGERNKRHKARLKYLVNSIGLDTFLEEVERERITLPYQSFLIEYHEETPSTGDLVIEEQPKNQKAFENWRKTNVFSQKQEGYYAVAIKLQNGDFYTDQARALAVLIDQVAANDLRITPDQNLLLKYVRAENLAYLYNQLSELTLEDDGFNTIVDITACPGTDTCNLGISNSTGTSVKIEEFIRQNHPEFINHSDINIKISGCMNACGQHTIAAIGFHGSSIKKGDLVIPALQVLLGGKVNGNGLGTIADKVIKVPSKKVLEVIDWLLKDFKANSNKAFSEYYQEKGKMYFYNLLKPLAEIEAVTQDLLIDWGNQEKYERAVGVGECAGVVIDLVSTLLLEVDEKIENAQYALSNNRYSDAIYLTYSAFVNGAKTVLTSKSIANNSQKSIIEAFDKELVQTREVDYPKFSETVYQIHSQEPSKAFAETYLAQGELFLTTIKNYINQPQLVLENN